MPDLFQVNLLSTEDMEASFSDEVPASEEKKQEPPVENKKPEGENPETVEKQKVVTPIVEIEGEDELEDLDKSQEQEKKKPSKKDIESSVNYKTLAEYYIEKGDWIKPDNWEDAKDEVEWDGEFFAKFQAQQFDAKVKAAIEDEKSAYSPDYQQLLEYAKSGGSIQDLLPSYQQQTEISELNPSDADHAEKIIQIECEAKGWSKKRTESYINSLKDQGDDTFSEFAKEAKDSIVQSIEEERGEAIKQQKVLEDQKRFQKEASVKKIREEISKFSEPDREKKDIEDFWLKPKYQNGDRKFSEFDKVSYEIHNDPVKFAKFVKILKNFDKLTEATPSSEKQIKAKAFEFLLSGQKDLGKNNNQTPDSEKKSKQKGIYNPFQISSGV